MFSFNHIIYAIVSSAVLAFVQHSHPEYAAVAMQFLLVISHALHVQPNGTNDVPPGGFGTGQRGSQ